MTFETTHGEIDLLRALEGLGLIDRRRDSSANAVSKYLRMHNFLRDDDQANLKDRGRRRQEYLVEMRSFEERIRCIRLLKRVEMSRSGDWNFTLYLKGAWTIVGCRVMLRLAYLAHALHIRGACRLAERAGFRVFNAIFFEADGLPGFA